MDTLNGKLMLHIDVAVSGLIISSAQYKASTNTYALCVDGNIVDTTLMVIKTQD